MYGLGDLLYKTGDYLLSNSIKRALAGAGLGLASVQILEPFVTSTLELALLSLKDSPSVVLSFMSIAGVDVALSIVISAIIARLTILQAHLYITKL